MKTCPGIKPRSRTGTKFFDFMAIARVMVKDLSVRTRFGFQLATSRYSAALRRRLQTPDIALFHLLDRRLGNLFFDRLLLVLA
jgi:hypothetical protein